ncbi:hypothetical protein MTBSS4_370020 [Magnetospirillum sp. SS-4]|nr:hypothetical protein MTBSS4_370020 [Magnetospirillum sp. SS-4]
MTLHSEFPICSADRVIETRAQANKKCADNLSQLLFGAYDLGLEGGYADYVELFCESDLQVHCVRGCLPVPAC